MKKYINRYTIGGVFVVALILWFCSLSQIAALILAPLAIGGIWLGWKGYARPTMKCVCGGEITPFGGCGPCGCRSKN